MNLQQPRDRRRDYEHRHIAMGLCLHCNEKALPHVYRCFRHEVIWQLRKAGLTKGVLNPTKRGEREKLVNALRQRFVAVRDGHLKPASETESLDVALRLRVGLNIAWGGRKGIRKFASLVKKMDRKAIAVANTRSPHE